MKAKQIVEALRKHTYKHPIAIGDKMAFLNTYVDADFCAVTSSGQVYEWEIKVSRADFLRDFKKRRHRIYSGEFDDHPHVRDRKKPNRFWYVAPPGIVRDGEIPEWSGYMECDPDSKELTIVKKAPLLWKGQHDLRDILKIARAMKRRGKPQP